MAGKKFTKQLEKAAKTAYFAIILGEDELNGGYLTLKNLETAAQIQFPLVNLADFETHTYKFISTNSSEWLQSKLSMLSSGFVM